jgi:hypothetical protein
MNARDLGFGLVWAAKSAAPKAQPRARRACVRPYSLTTTPAMPRQARYRYADMPRSAEARTAR